MKFIKRISLLFIYSAVIFGIGFMGGLAGKNYFYPGNLLTEQQEPEEEAVDTGFQAQPVITADTGYVVFSYDSLTGEAVETKEEPPDKYIGLTRDMLVEALQEYEESPSLSDLEKGLTGVELLSFSPERVVVRKNYERNETGFYLVNMDHFVVVYDKSLTHLYMETGILLETLPWKVQNEIMHMKYMETERELYDFLESYSS